MTGTERRCAIGLVVLYAVMYLLPLGMRPLIAPDEVRYAEIAREMIESGNRVSPHFNGVRYFEKPILGHWLNAGSFELFGYNAYALRLPSALAAGLTALLIYWLTVRFANRRAALLAAGIYLTSFEVFGIGTFAVLDTYLALFLTAAFVAWYFAHRSGGGAARQKALIACGLACGGAFLTKGFLALAIPTIVVGGFLALERRWRELLTTPWLPIAAALVVTLPWAVLIYLREPDFWHYFIVVEHLQRFAGDDAQHAEASWYFLLRTPFAALPWFLLAPLAWRGLPRDAGHRSLVRYSVCWFVLPFVFFSISRGKLMTYVLPCFAPLAIWLALGLERAAANAARLRLRWPAAILAVFFAASLAALLAAQAGLFGEPVYAHAEWPAFGLMFATLLGACLAAAGSMRARSPERQLALYGLTALPVLALICLATPERFLTDKAPGAFIASRGPYESDAVLVADYAMFGSLAWYLHRTDINVLGPSEIDYGLDYPADRRRRLDADSLARVIANNIGRREIVILTKDSRESLFVDALPQTAERAQRGGLVLWRIAGP